MAPNRETPVGSYPEATDNTRGNPPILSVETLQRTVSDVTSELSKEAIREADGEARLPLPIHELEDARCECCGMSEECTPEYVSHVRDKFSGKLVCGLCAEAVRVEMERGGGKSWEEALAAHIDACLRFNRIGRAYPVLYQAEAMREILKRSSSGGGGPRAKSISPRDGGGLKKAAIARSSSCMPAITRGANYDGTAVN
ncbi:uncharacterized protein LOC115741039 [Rhodamnia argentea]|uniref:Uncharacterized protein LOC115741039 n=1 Tax=Rhodamnia argentea TaxID=178133 RepID=A0A8B8P7J7_9MYRT|nr:uncharacterized protein LOC115741039 [Rhodamnia argentea]